MSVVGLVACLGMMVLMCQLVVPHQALVSSRANLGQRIPPIALAASANLRANPLDVWGTIQILSPAGQRVSFDAGEVAMFRQARQAGVSAPAIDRVLTNGFVDHDDRSELLEALLAAQVAESADRSALSRLVAQVAQAR